MRPTWVTLVLARHSHLQAPGSRLPPTVASFRLLFTKTHELQILVRIPVWGFFLLISKIYETKFLEILTATFKQTMHYEFLIIDFQTCVPCFFLGPEKSLPSTTVIGILSAQA